MNQIQYYIRHKKVGTICSLYHTVVVSTISPNNDDAIVRGKTKRPAVIKRSVFSPEGLDGYVIIFEANAGLVDFMRICLPTEWIVARALPSTIDINFIGSEDVLNHMSDSTWTINLF